MVIKNMPYLFDFNIKRGINDTESLKYPIVILPLNH